MSSKTEKWEVKGMNCVGCANTVKNLLDSMGMRDVFVDFSSDEVQFINAPGTPAQQIIQGIEKLGYTVRLPEEPEKKN